MTGARRCAGEPAGRCGRQQVRGYLTERREPGRGFRGKRAGRVRQERQKPERSPIIELCSQPAADVIVDHAEPAPYGGLPLPTEDLPRPAGIGARRVRKGKARSEIVFVPIVESLLAVCLSGKIYFHHWGGVGRDSLAHVCAAQVEPFAQTDIRGHLQAVGLPGGREQGMTHAHSQGEVSPASP